MKRLHFTKCRTSLLAVLLAFSVAFVPVPPISDTSSDSAALITTAQAAQKNTKDRFSIKEVPKYNGKSSVAVHGNKPYFTSREKQNTNTFESYHKLDKLGRCGVAYANVSKDTMPTEARGEIGQIRPSGWHTVKYTIAVNICRAYLKHGGNETETMLLIQKYLTPVRYNRKYTIHLRPKRNRDFMYRVA